MEKTKEKGGGGTWAKERQSRRACEGDSFKRATEKRRIHSCQSSLGKTAKKEKKERIMKERILTFCKNMATFPSFFQILDVNKEFLGKNGCLFHTLFRLDPKSLLRPKLKEGKG